MNTSYLSTKWLAPTIGVLIAIGLIILPMVLSSYMVSLVIKILLWSLFGLSLNLLMGYTGYNSFGHAAFWGLGGYTAGILVVRGIIGDFALIMLAVSGVAIIAGIIFGLVAFRAKAISFAFITVALQQVLYTIAYKWTSVTRGEDGLSGIGRPFSLHDTGFYFLVLAVFVLLLFMLYWIISSRFGRIIRGIRENEYRMQSLGYNVWAYKYICYILSGLFGALAGALFVFYNGFVGVQELSFSTSGIAMLTCIIGGRGTFLGPVIGAVIVVFLSELLSAFTNYWLLFLGIIFVVVVMVAPKGVGGYLFDYWKTGLKRTHGDLKA